MADDPPFKWRSATIVEIERKAPDSKAAIEAADAIISGYLGGLGSTKKPTPEHENVLRQADAIDPDKRRPRGLAKQILDPRGLPYGTQSGYRKLCRWLAARKQ